MVNLKALQTFVQVAQVGSYSVAAQQLHLSQPTVSVHIKALETDFQTKLLRFDGQRYRATADGAIVLSYAAKIFQLTDQLEQTFVRPVQPTLKVAATSVLSLIAPQMYAAVHQTGAELYLNISNATGALDSLAAGVVDCALAALSSDQVATYQSRYALLPLATDAVYLVASRQNPLSKLTQVTPEDLQQQVFVMREAGSGTATLLTEFLRAQQIKAQSILRVPQHATVAQTIQNGMGIGLLSQYWLQSAAATLTTLPVANFPVKREIYLLAPRATNQLREFAALITELLTAAQKKPTTP